MPPGNVSAPEMLSWLLDHGSFWRLSVEIDHAGDRWEAAVFHGKALHVYEDRNWREAVAKAYAAVRKG